MFVFTTFINQGLKLGDEINEPRKVKVTAYMKPAPDRGVGRIEVEDCQTKERIPLESLSKTEREGLIDEANGEIRYLGM